MEIMTKEEYVEEMLKKVFVDLRVAMETEMRFKALMNGNFEHATDDDKIDEAVRYKASTEMGISEAEYESLLGGALDEAYEYYCDANTKDHIFDVEFHYTVCGKVQVHAEDEDEARDYVVTNLSLNGSDAYFDDDEKVVDEIELYDDYLGDGIEIDSVGDTGDEWDED